MGIHMNKENKQQDIKPIPIRPTPMSILCSAARFVEKELYSPIEASSKINFDHSKMNLFQRPTRALYEKSDSVRAPHPQSALRSQAK